ncbi:unnamed protein product [Spodoptera exigua]|nr:unnamed protein product [Spodoptera exigua]
MVTSSKAEDNTGQYWQHRCREIDVKPTAARESNAEEFGGRKRVQGCGNNQLRSAAARRLPERVVRPCGARTPVWRKAAASTHLRRWSPESGAGRCGGCGQCERCDRRCQVRMERARACDGGGGEPAVVLASGEARVRACGRRRGRSATGGAAAARSESMCRARSPQPACRAATCASEAARRAPRPRPRSA